jgi:hypothetical protein
VNIRAAVAADASLRLSGDLASLRIVGWAKDSLVITGSLPKGARFDGGVGSGSAQRPSRAGKFYVEQSVGAPLATLEVHLPSRARLWVKAANAQVEVSGSTGGLDLNVVGGAIIVQGDPSELNIESMDGTVAVTGSPAWMRVKTASGDIIVRGSSEDAAFTTVSGTLSVGGGRYERARIETVTGNASFAGDLVPSGTLTADTHSGLLELAVGKMSSVEIDAITIAGSIENRATKQAPIAGRQGRGQELGTQIGDGSARANLRSFKGTIRVVLR